MPLVLVPLGLVYIIETLSDIIQVLYFKATHGKRFFKMAPFHHHLELCGWSEVKIVAVASALTLAMAVLTLAALVLSWLAAKTAASVPVLCRILVGMPFAEACRSCNWIYTFKKLKK